MGRASGAPLNIGSQRARDILRVIEAGWKRAQNYPDVHSGADEVPLNGRLLEGMRETINERNTYSYRRISVLPGTESRSEEDAAVPDGLTDIAIHLRDIR